MSQLRISADQVSDRLKRRICKSSTVSEGTYTHTLQCLDWPLSSPLLYSLRLLPAHYLVYVSVWISSVCMLCR